MKENKWTILIGFPLTVVALAGAWYLDSLGKSFGSNVLLGLFGSGFLTLFVALVNYLTKRREALENFWTLGYKAARAFNRYPIDGSPEEKMEAILLINEFDFDAVGDAYAAIDFLLGNKNKLTFGKIPQHDHRVNLMQMVANQQEAALLGHFGKALSMDLNLQNSERHRHHHLQQKAVISIFFFLRLIHIHK